MTDREPGFPLPFMNMTNVSVVFSNKGSMSLLTIALDIWIGILVLAMIFTGVAWFWTSHVTPTMGWKVG